MKRNRIESPWPHFYVDEIECPCGCGGGVEEMDPGFMDKIVALREMVGFPLPAHFYRCKARNKIVSDTGPKGAHVQGRGVDLRVYGAQVLDVIAAAFEVGLVVPPFDITDREARGGIGVYQHGTNFQRRFVHLDDLTEEERGGGPRPWFWTYPGPKQT